MIQNLLLSVGFDELGEAIPVAEGNGLGIEATLYDTAWLMSEGAVEDARHFGADLAKRGIPTTTHGPLYDLNPGSLDPTIRAYSEYCFLRGVEVAGALGAGKIVFHTAYNPLLPDGVLKGWKEIAAPAWENVRKAASERGVQVCLENSYEPTVEFFKDLYEAFAGQDAAVCFDPAHVHLYSRDGQSAWMVCMGDRVTHIHLNDNGGKSDDHLALGEGNIPYGSFLREVCEICGEATVVLEMPVDRALRSIEFLRDHSLWPRG